MRIWVKMRQSGSRVDIGLDGVEITTEVKEICAGAAQMLADASREVVRTKAKHRTGLLEKSISCCSYASMYGAGAFVGWERLPVKRSRGVIRTSDEVYYDKNGVKKHYRGFGRNSHANAIQASYTDKNGRVRVVESVEDYAGILEYSKTRVLKHVVPVYRAMESQLENYIENEIDKLLDRAGL